MVLVMTVVCTLWFLRLMLLGVCCDASVLSRAFVLRSPLELIIMPLQGWQHIPSPSLAGSQTWVSSTTRGRRFAFEGQPQLPHSMGREQGMGPPESYSGIWGILVHPSPPVQAYLWTTSFIGRIFPGLHTG